jgi:hypothetical protein
LIVRERDWHSYKASGDETVTKTHRAKALTLQQRKRYKMSEHKFTEEFKWSHKAIESEKFVSLMAAIDSFFVPSESLDHQFHFVDGFMVDKETEDRYPIEIKQDKQWFDTLFWETLTFKYNGTNTKIIPGWGVKLMREELGDDHRMLLIEGWETEKTDAYLMKTNVFKNYMDNKLVGLAGRCPMKKVHGTQIDDRYGMQQVSYGISIPWDMLSSVYRKYSWDGKDWREIKEDQF